MSENPDHLRRPQHVAIIMDGNGRWAQQRGQPRGFGHRAGGNAARQIIRSAWDAGVAHLTLFAFSTENWERPQKEVGLLMDLFRRTLIKDVRELHDNDVRIRFIGDHSRFDPSLREEMARAEDSTRGNAGLRLNIAIGYGGRQDLVAAARRLALEVAAGRLRADQIDEEAMAAAVALGDLPEPDLFIRTGGEVRISNFLLWQLAYTELYFCDVLWPDFTPAHLNEALSWFAARDRRFGQVGAGVPGDARVSA